MHIDIVDNLAAFTDLKGNWDSVYEADPEAQFFLSWTWLWKWIQRDDRWLVLAAKPAADAPYVAFFPLTLETKMRNEGGFDNHLTMAGANFADYTGFICTPEFQDSAIPAFAERVERFNWATLDMMHLRASDERTDLFVGHFQGKGFGISETKSLVEQDVELRIFPYVELPADWNTYLDRLSSSTRQKARRFLRKVENSEDFRITISDAETAKRDLEILLNFWKAKWGSHKGDLLEGMLTNLRIMLMHCFKSGTLFLPILWKGETPLGALASLIDREKRSLRFFIGGRDESFNAPPPGFVLHAYSIRYAIGEGFTTYDFLRGDEAYKYGFGAVNRRTTDVVVSTASGRNLRGKVDARTLPTVLERSLDLHQSGQLAKAKIGYRQILEVEPEHRKALFGISQLLAAEGDHGAAVKSLRNFVALEPDAYKAWFNMGDSLVALGEFAAAADAYREVVNRRPEFIAYKNLGDALLHAGRVEEAIAAFETALDKKPNDPEAETTWASTVGMLGTLPEKDRERHAALVANLGNKFRECGANAVAIDCYRHAIDMKPGLITAQHGLGLALQG